MIAFKIGKDTYRVSGFPLAEMLTALGIHDGEPSDWIQNEKVVEWVKSNGILEIPEW